MRGWHEPTGGGEAFQCVARNGTQDAVVFIAAGLPAPEAGAAAEARLDLAADRFEGNGGNLVLQGRQVARGVLADTQAGVAQVLGAPAGAGALVGLGGRLAIDATTKIGPERRHPWGEPLRRGLAAGVKMPETEKLVAEIKARIAVRG